MVLNIIFILTGQDTSTKSRIYHPQSFEYPHWQRFVNQAGNSPHAFLIEWRVLSLSRPSVVIECSLN